MGGAPISIAGTAASANCLSTQPRTAEKCGSYFCGVSQDQLSNAMGLDPSKPCGTDVAVACKGTLTKIVTECAQGVAGDVEQTRTCVAGNAEVQADMIPAGCYNCFIDAVACCTGNVNCLLTCLGVETDEQQRACDAAQLAAQCPLSVFSCGGLPNPF